MSLVGSGFRGARTPHNRYFYLMGVFQASLEEGIDPELVKEFLQIHIEGEDEEENGPRSIPDHDAAQDPMPWNGR